MERLVNPLTSAKRILDNREGVGWEESALIFLIIRDTHRHQQRNQPWSGRFALPAMGVGSMSPYSQTAQLRQCTQEFRRDEGATESPSSRAKPCSVGKANTLQKDIGHQEQISVWGEAKRSFMNYFCIFTMSSNAEQMDTEQNRHGEKKNAEPHFLQPNGMYSINPELRTNRGRLF